MKLTRITVLAVSSALALSNTLFSSQSPESPQDLPKTVAVAAFKNGLAFVVRQGEIHLQSGTGRITPIPNATLGTLWLAPGESGASLDEVVAYHYNVDRTAQHALASEEVLQANAGKTVTVTYNNKDYTGEIVGLHNPDSNSHKRRAITESRTRRQA